MLGRDHALSGAVTFAVAAPLTVHLTGVQLAAGTVLTAGAALLPDFDEPGSLIARRGGFLTMGFAHLVRRVSGGHRKGTHSLFGAAVFTGIAWAAVTWSGSLPGRAWLFAWLALLMSAALRCLPIIRGHHPDLAGIAAAAGMCFWPHMAGVWHPALILVPVCTGLGVLAHIAGDMMTRDGCPLLWPASEYDFHDTPAAFTTGKLFEHWIVSPLLTISLALVLAHDMAVAAWF